MCGINAVGAQGSGCMFTLCHAPLKMAVLLHKTGNVCRVMITAVICFSRDHPLRGCSLDALMPLLWLLAFISCKGQVQIDYISLNILVMSTVFSRYSRKLGQP